MRRWRRRYMAAGGGRPVEGCDPPARQQAAAGGDDQAGGGPDVARDAACRHPLERAHDGGEGGDCAVVGAQDLEGARAEAALGRDLQAVARSGLRRQGGGRRRPLPQPAGQGAGAVGRREEPDSGARPHPAGTADEEGPGRHDDPRLQASRHHHPVRGAQRAGRHGHRQLHAPPSAPRVPALSQAHRQARHRPISTCI